MPLNGEKDNQRYNPYEKEKNQFVYNTILIRDRGPFPVPKQGLNPRDLYRNHGLFNDTPWTVSTLTDNPDILTRIIEKDPNNSPQIEIGIPFWTYDNPSYPTKHPVNYKPDPRDRINNIITLTCRLKIGQLELRYNDRPKDKQGLPTTFYSLIETMDKTDLTQYFFGKMNALAQKEEDSGRLSGKFVEIHDVEAAVSMVVMFMRHSDQETVAQFENRTKLREEAFQNPDSFFATLSAFTGSNLDNSLKNNIHAAAQKSWVAFCYSLKDVTCRSNLLDENSFYNSSADTLVRSMPDTFLEIMSKWKTYRKEEANEIIAMINTAASLKRHNIKRYNKTSRLIDKAPINEYFSITTESGPNIPIQPYRPPKPLSLPESSISRNTLPLPPKKRPETDPSHIDTGEPGSNVRLDPGETDDFGFDNDYYESLNNPDFPTSE